MDFLEVFAGTGIVTDLASSFGLSALQPFDLLYGQDLKDRHVVHQLHQTVDQFRPLPHFDSMAMHFLEHLQPEYELQLAVA